VGTIVPTEPVNRAKNEAGHPSKPGTGTKFRKSSEIRASPALLPNLTVAQEGGRRGIRSTQKMV